MILTVFGREADGKENKLYIGQRQSLEMFDCSVSTSVGYINFVFTQSQIQWHSLMDQIWLMGYHVKKPGTKMWKCADVKMFVVPVRAADRCNWLCKSPYTFAEEYIFSLLISGAGIYKSLHCFQTYTCMTQVASFTLSKLWTNKLYRLKNKNKIWVCLQK